MYGRTQGIAVFVFLATVLFTGCSIGEQANEREPGKRGGTVVIGIRTKPDVLNPLLTMSETAIMLFDGLTGLDKDLSPTPHLAESWEISDDGRTYTFHLRRGVTFHDGAEFTAEDVKFTYEISRNPDNRTPEYDLNQIARLDVIDPYTVRIVLNRVDPGFLAHSMGFSILPGHLLEGKSLRDLPFNRHPVGTGPFRFEGWEDSSRMALVANEDYFKGRPNLDRIVFRTGLDQSELWVRLMRQEVDVIQSSLTPEDMKIVRDDSTTFKLTYSGLEPSYHMLLYNLDDPRFADRRVRRAIAYALDKQEIIDRALLGFGTLTSGPFWPDSWAYVPAIQPVPYDPHQALRLLADAGWIDRNEDGLLDKDGQPFEVGLLLMIGDKSMERTALIIRQRLQEIGVRLRLERVNISTLLNKRLPSGAFEMAIFTYNAGRDPSTAKMFWHSKNIRPRRLNFARYRNARVDSLLDADNVMAPLPERRRIYHRVHAIMAADHPATFFFFKHAAVAVNRRVAGIESGTGYSIYNSAGQWYLRPQ